jgi:hypothetical protein
MKLSRLVAAGAAALVTAGFGIGFAAPASANQVWIQQVQRASADAPCDIPAVEGDAAGWSAWAPSWAQWPNGGEGGWVCSRSITWAKDTPPPGANSPSAYPSAGCVLGAPTPEYVDFAGGWSLDTADVWGDAACTADYFGVSPYQFVYAPDGASQAADLCAEAGFTVGNLQSFAEPVWVCDYFPA